MRARLLSTLSVLTVAVPLALWAGCGASGNAQNAGAGGGGGAGASGAGGTSNQGGSSSSNVTGSSSGSSSGMTGSSSGMTASSSGAGTGGSGPCGAGMASCSGTCVDTSSDPANCGMCGNHCPSGPNSTASCAGGLCGLTCTNPFADCDSNPANGCEVNLNNGVIQSGGSVNSCGACSVNCAAQPGGSNSSAVCNAGNCAINCTDAANFLNCDGLDANGCEQAINVPTHCGTCINNCITSIGAASAICLANHTCSSNPTNVNCGTATVIPVVAPGATAVTVTGPLPHGTSEQWFTVTFTLRPGTPAARYASTPTIQLTSSAGRPTFFDIFTGTCASHSSFTCNTNAIGGASEGSTGITNWSYDDVTTDAQGATTRMGVNPATATFIIRVYNAGAASAPDSNLPFTLRITNP